METVGFHTTEDRGDPDYVESNAPFRSVGTLAFLGTGYYFWEDSPELAHWWGELHCNGEYIICEGTIRCDDSIYFDLVGSVKHQRHLRELQTALRDELIREFQTEKVPLGILIEFLKRLESKVNRKGIFPFKVIRAVDNLAKSIYLMKFAPGKQNYTDLAPRIIICLTEKNAIFLPAFRIIFPEKYVI